jgi:hypothetical protein
MASTSWPGFDVFKEVVVWNPAGSIVEVRAELLGSVVMMVQDHEMGAALDGFSRRLARGEPSDVLEIKSVDGLKREINRINAKNP